MEEKKGVVLLVLFLIVVVGCSKEEAQALVIKRLNL